MGELLTAHQALVNWAGKTPDREFLLQPVNGQLHATSWRDAEQQARCMASALAGLGLAPGDKVAILAKNSAEWVLADCAIAMAGMVSVPIYPTASVDTIAFVIGHSEARAIFVGKLDEPNVVAKALPETLPRIAFPYPTLACQYDWQDLVENNEPLQSLHEPDADEVMTILYTSGSTGRPKGVVLSYGAYAHSCEIARSTIGIGPDDRILSYLPLSHITERAIVVGPALYGGATCSFVESLKTFTHDLKTARPTLFLSVPRLWVKFQAGVHALIPPAKLRILLAIPIVRGIIARKIRAGLGFDSSRLFASGTAPIAPITLEWYRKLGVNISEGWGMTETGGIACVNHPFQASHIGTIGAPVEGTDMKLSDDGEILIRSPGMFSEYFRQPDLTQEAFTDDGFFRTGDKGEWDDELGAFRITGRVKDIFKSAKGKYVVPVPIESRLSGNPLLEQICVMGAGLPAPVAVVVLSAAARNLPREQVEASLHATLVDVNRHLESHERLSHLLIADDEWTIENGLLTPTLKVKRDQLETRYESVIGRSVGGSVAWE